MCFLNGKLTITHQYQEILTGLCTTYRLSLTTFICKIFRNSGCCSYITKNSYCSFVVERAYCIIVSSFDCNNYYLIVLCQMPASNLYRDFNSSRGFLPGPRHTVNSYYSQLGDSPSNLSVGARFFIGLCLICQPSDSDAAPSRLGMRAKRAQQKY